MKRNQKKRLVIAIIILMELVLVTGLGIFYVIKKNEPAQSRLDDYNSSHKMYEMKDDKEKILNSNGEKVVTVTRPDYNVVNSETASQSGVSTTYGPYPLTQVDTSYFDDALFVGDSRTVGLRAYTDLGNADFFARTGISTSALFTYPAADEETGLTLTQTLTSGKTYKKIYIMLGVNDLSYGTLETFIDEFKTAIDKIRLLQSEAVIYVESIIGVTKGMEASKSEKFSQTTINERNAALESICDGRNLIYLDVASAMKDSEGYLTQEFSADGLHLNSDYYYLWTDYLLGHAAAEIK